MAVRRWLTKFLTGKITKTKETNKIQTVQISVEHNDRYTRSRISVLKASIHVAAVTNTVEEDAG